MSERDIYPFNWSRYLYDRLRGDVGRGLFSKIFRYDDIEYEMDNVLDIYENIGSIIPKELVIEYKTLDDDLVKEVGPIVYGYSITIEPDGKPRVREFGNLRKMSNMNQGGHKNFRSDFKITTERAPLADVYSSDREVKVILEIPGFKKEDIKINANDTMIEINANNSQRKYHKTIELPYDADINTARSTYNNGILEITIAKRVDARTKGKEIKIDWS